MKRMRPSKMAVAALMVLIATVGILAAMQSAGRTDTPRDDAIVAQMETSTPEPTGTLWIISPGLGTPTPFVFSTRDDVVRYVRALLPPSAMIVNAHVRRTTTREIATMHASPGAVLLTPDPARSAHQPAGTPGPGPRRWIAGLVLLNPISGPDLDKVMGLGGLVETSPAGDPRYGREVYLVMDDVGFITSAGFLDGVNPDGELEHQADWHLSDIDRLPEAP
jgi:hypothetical protein